MNEKQKDFSNCIVLIMGLPGVGKQTVGEALILQTNFKLVSDWITPILKLMGDDEHVMWELDEKGWQKLNEADDLILATITDVCPKDGSYIIPQMMFAEDPYHQIFYDKVLSVVEKRQAHFFPIRLLCDEEPLAQRVQAENRKQSLKTRDPELSRRRSSEQKVFHSQHANEISIDNTQKTPDDVAKIIIEHIHTVFENA